MLRCTLGSSSLQRMIVVNTYYKKYAIACILVALRRARGKIAKNNDEYIDFFFINLNEGKRK